MKFFNKIRKWSIEKKRIFAISTALFITILVIFLNSIINTVWPDNSKKVNLAGKNNPITSLQESFSKIFDEAQPILEKAFGSSTQQLIDQDISTSSSFSTTSNIVE